MRQPVLTSLRGADGRRLAAALACLMLIVGLISGLHIGSALGGETTGVFCGHAAGGPSDGQPASGRADLCCVAGCLAHAPALDAPPPAVAAPKLAGGIAITGPALSSPVRGTVLINRRQRGPPSLA
jgi:hypothetical protein